MPATKLANHSDDARKELIEFEGFHEKHPEVEYVRLMFIDNSGMRREILIPVDAFRHHLRKQKWPTIFGGCENLTSHDTLAPPAMALGVMPIKPDVTTLLANTIIRSPSASAMSWWMADTDGTYSIRHNCPRGALRRIERALATDFGAALKMGIEIEVCLVRPIVDETSGEINDFSPTTTIHNCYHLSYQQLSMLPIIEEIVRELKQIGINLPVFHAEAAPGQWEFPLPPAQPLKAVDMYYQARSVIEAVAFKHKLKATFYPRPYPAAPGTASHLHYSIEIDEKEIETNQMYDNFLAGVLKHLSSIAAFTLSQEESYQRIAPGIWGGGEFVAWGRQNREVPIRQCGGEQHWEFRTIDGLGNMYLCAGAILAAGLDGMRRKETLRIQDCQCDLSAVSERQRAELGVHQRLPTSLPQSLKALEGDESLTEILTPELTKPYISLKRAEMELLKPMGEKERRIWLMQRY